MIRFRRDISRSGYPLASGGPPSRSRLTYTLRQIQQAIEPTLFLPAIPLRVDQIARAPAEKSRNRRRAVAVLVPEAWQEITAAAEF